MDGVNECIVCGEEIEEENTYLCSKECEKKYNNVLRYKQEDVHLELKRGITDSIRKYAEKENLTFQEAFADILTYGLELRAGHLGLQSITKTSDTRDGLVDKIWRNKDIE